MKISKIKERIKRRIDWIALMRAQKKVWLGSYTNEKITPAHPGYVEFYDILDYLEKYTLASAMYLIKYGTLAKQKEHIHELWQLRKMIRKARGIEEKWQNWQDTELKKTFGGDTEPEFSHIPLENGYYRFYSFFKGYNKMCVEAYYEKNKEEIDKYYTENVMSLNACRLKGTNVLKEGENPVDYIQPTDIIDFEESRLMKIRHEEEYKETCETYDNIGKFIFSPVYRYSLWYGPDEIKNPKYREGHRLTDIEYKKLSAKEKEAVGRKYPSIFMWDD